MSTHCSCRCICGHAAGSHHHVAEHGSVPTANARITLAVVSRVVSVSGGAYGGRLASIPHIRPLYLHLCHHIPQLVVTENAL
jgi:hypothetical protein